MAASETAMVEFTSYVPFEVQQKDLATLGELAQRAVSLRKAKGWLKQGFFNNSNSVVAIAKNNIRKNTHIELLILGKQFLRSYETLETKSETDCVDMCRMLLKMSALKTLILDNKNWHKDVFNSLQRYLTDPRCQIETLVLNNGLTAKEIKQLEVTFKHATSLRTYEGAAHSFLQNILNKRNEEPLLITSPASPSYSSR